MTSGDLKLLLLIAANPKLTIEEATRQLAERTATDRAQLSSPGTRPGVRCLNKGMRTVLN
jgi:hypothetical protein